MPSRTGDTLSCTLASRSISCLKPATRVTGGGVGGRLPRARGPWSSSVQTGGTSDWASCASATPSRRRRCDGGGRNPRHDEPHQWVRWRGLATDSIFRRSGRSQTRCLEGAALRAGYLGPPRAFVRHPRPYERPIRTDGTEVRTVRARTARSTLAKGVAYTTGRESYAIFRVPHQGGLSNAGRVPGAGWEDRLRRERTVKAVMRGSDHWQQTRVRGGGLNERGCSTGSGAL